MQYDDIKFDAVNQGQSYTKTKMAAGKPNPPIYLWYLYLYLFELCVAHKNKEIKNLHARLQQNSKRRNFWSFFKTIVSIITYLW